jgi:hypothetical protein
MEPTVVRVTCTAVLLAPGKPLRSHQFNSLSIPSEFIAEREGVHSVMTATLLAAVTSSIKSEGSLPECFRLIFSESVFDIFITVATSRVPAFDHTMQTPSFGYRHIGHLAAIPTLHVPPPPVFDHINEILAMDADSDHTATRSFIRVWKPCGFDPTLHFILILEHPFEELPRHESPYTSGSHSPSFTSWSEGSEIEGFIRRTPGNQYVAAPSPLAVDTPSFSDGEVGVSTTESFARSYTSVGPGFLSGASSASPLTIYNPEESIPTYNTVSPATSAMLTATTTLDQLCVALQIPPDIYIGAKYEENANRNSLFKLVQNHRAASIFLTCIGLKGFREEGNLNASIKFTGGLEIGAGDVLCRLGWAEKSYEKKSEAYLWAEVAAMQTWKNPSNGPREYENYYSLICISFCHIFVAKDSGRHAEYNAWQGIRFLFLNGGALDANRPPHPASHREAEIFATKLSQNQLFTPFRTKIKACIA